MMWVLCFNFFYTQKKGISLVVKRKKWLFDFRSISLVAAEAAGWCC